MYLVYKHTSPSGKSYIGYTGDYDRRCTEHQKYKGCRHFYAAIKKYGWDNFTHEILYDNLTAEQAKERECQSINEYGSMAPYGYNLTSGGEGWAHTLETRARMSATLTGRKLSNDHKRKISEARKRNDTPEMRARQAERSRGRTHDEATRSKMSTNSKGKGARDYLVTTPAGEQLHVTNLKQYCIDNDLTVTTMRRIAQGALTTHKGGWRCAYV